jgi:hypothetical protein
MLRFGIKLVKIVDLFTYTTVSCVRALERIAENMTTVQQHFNTDPALPQRTVSALEQIAASIAELTLLQRQPGAICDGES